MNNQTITKDRSHRALGKFYSYSANPKDFTLVHPASKFHNRTLKHGSEKVSNTLSHHFVLSTTSPETPETLVKIAILNCLRSFGIQGKKNTSEAKIDEYFSCSPSIRAQKREQYAAYIKCAKDVFKILELGNTRNIVDAYDGAVDILAECDKDIITEAFGIAKKKYISHIKLEIAESWEKNWEILIKALSCGLKIKSDEKMFLLLTLCNPKYKLSRLIKLTLIDAIVDLDIDVDLAKVMLQIFMSERESDSFVRQYAEKQAVECL